MLVVLFQLYEMLPSLFKSIVQRSLLRWCISQNQLEVHLILEGGILTVNAKWDDPCPASLHTTASAKLVYLNVLTNSRSSPPGFHSCQASDHA